MKGLVFTFIFLVYINMSYGYAIESKNENSEVIIEEAANLLWEFYTFELKKKTYLSSFSNNCFIVDNPGSSSKRVPIVNEMIKQGMRLIISENCEIALYDEDGTYNFNYSDYGKFTFVEIVVGSLLLE